MNERKHGIYKKIHLLSLLVGTLTIVFPLVFWSKIPDQIPMHYNTAGVPDSWSDKSSLILLFFVVLMLMGVMSIVVYVVKSGMNSKYSSGYEKSTMDIVYPMIIIMNLIIQVMFAYIMFCCVTCRPLGSLFLPVFLIGIFLPVVFMIYKISQIKGTSRSQKAFYEEREKSQQGVLYRSKVDWWLGLILAGAEAMVLFFAVEPLVRRGEVEWVVIFTAMITTVVILPLFTIKYVMYSEHLLVSMGFYGKVRVQYKDIIKMTKTMNPLSSAAMSLKRIQIDYGENGTHKMILISPKDRDGFIAEVEKKKLDFMR